METPRRTRSSPTKVPPVKACLGPHSPTTKPGARVRPAGLLGRSPACERYCFLTKTNQWRATGSEGERTQRGTQCSVGPAAECSLTFALATACQAGATALWGRR